MLSKTYQIYDDMISSVIHMVITHQLITLDSHTQQSALEKSIASNTAYTNYCVSIVGRGGYVHEPCHTMTMAYVELYTLD